MGLHRTSGVVEVETTAPRTHCQGDSENTCLNRQSWYMNASGYNDESFEVICNFCQRTNVAASSPLTADLVVRLPFAQPVACSNACRWSASRSVVALLYGHRHLAAAQAYGIGPCQRGQQQPRQVASRRPAQTRSAWLSFAHHRDDVSSQSMRDCPGANRICL